MKAKKPTWRYEHVTLDRVIDGDTVRLVIDLGFSLTRASNPYRFARLNAPELSTPEGVKTKEAIEQMLANRVLWIESLGPDKYGRWLVELYAGGVNVNDWLLANKLAVPMKD